MEQHVNDHDLLVRLDEKLDGISATVNKFNESLNSKADAKTFDSLVEKVNKLEDKLEKSQRFMYMIIGALVLLEAIAGIVRH